MPIHDRGFRTKGDVRYLNLSNWGNNECDSILVSDGSLTQLLPMLNSTVHLECRYKLGLSIISGSRSYNSAPRSMGWAVYFQKLCSVPLPGAPKLNR